MRLPLQPHGPSLHPSGGWVSVGLLSQLSRQGDVLAKASRALCVGMCVCVYGSRFFLSESDQQT